MSDEIECEEADKAGKRFIALVKGTSYAWIATQAQISSIMLRTM